MPLRIEDYAMVGDTHTAALVGRDGSIDWLCLPRFDSGAVFAGLLGDERHGRWLVSPKGGIWRVRRTYREGTLVLETEFETEEGVVRLVDCMSHPHRHADLVRVVEGVRGRVPMRMELTLRFDYGWIVPWVRRVDGALLAVAGPDALALQAGVETRGENLATVAEFSVAEGQRVPFVLTWFPSNDPLPDPASAEALIRETEAAWRTWSSRCTYKGEWREAVLRSCITLKALTYQPTGGIVAAPTTSLPESLGGVRNWDYRYVWLRDATFTLYALMITGYTEEARAWRDWLLRAVAGDPGQLQIMYGPAGERRLPELELAWLPGYEGSRPVRIGNAAVSQFQLDVYGEVMDALHVARRSGIAPEPHAWALQRAFLEFLEANWERPDQGIWEVRGPRRHFTHSKVMAWVAFDRAVKAVERFGLDGPVDRWRTLRAAIHEQVCREAYDPERNTFTQYQGSRELDASLLLIPLV
ncbi:MAG: glycoside hydrolase family 15 protein, partial [Acidimicrobiia bacterium]